MKQYPYGYKQGGMKMKQDTDREKNRTVATEKTVVNGIGKSPLAAKKTIIRLEAGAFTDKKKAHSYLKKALGFPAYYGNNLDALYDCLGDLDRAVVIELPQAVQDEAHLGDYGKTMLQVFQDAAAGNSLLEIRLK